MSDLCVHYCNHTCTAILCRWQDSKGKCKHDGVLTRDTTTPTDPRDYTAPTDPERRPL